MKSENVATILGPPLIRIYIEINLSHKKHCYNVWYVILSRNLFIRIKKLTHPN